MKRLGLILIAGLCGLAGHAQTNPPATPRPPTFINSQSVDFDLTAHQAIYRGHVRVDDPAMKLACEWLVADLPQAGGRVNHIVAETNVVIDFTDEKGQKMHTTSDRAVYAYEVQSGATNETITLTGNPQLENAQGTMTGDVIVWDRIGNRLSATNQKMVFRQNLGGGAADTNAPATNTMVNTNNLTPPKESHE